MAVKAVLMDLDGTVYAGNELIPGALEAIRFVREKGIRLFFFTNNSEKNRAQIAKKLADMGIPCFEEDVVSSGSVSADFIKERGYRKVFLSGSDALMEEFVNSGVDLVDENNAETLVIGMDSAFDYQKMKKALNAAMSSKHIIACNVERRFPCGKGEVCPGNGALVASIEFSSGKKISEIIGKPNSLMLEHVLALLGISPDELLVVGDTYESDIVLALNSGAKGILVGSDPEYPHCIGSIGQLPDAIRRICRYR